MAAVSQGLRVLGVCADSATFDRRMFKVVHDFLHAHPASNHNLRRAGKRKLAPPFLLRQWKRLASYARTDIERHCAWMKRSFGLKYYQRFTWLRVTRFVLLSCSAALAVARAAERYRRPEFHRSRASVLTSLHKYKSVKKGMVFKKVCKRIHHFADMRNVLLAKAV